MPKRLRKFLSTSFHEPVGQRIDPVGVRGYYVDLSVKARTPEFSAAWRWAPGTQPWVAFAQLGIGAFERHLAGEGEQWLDLAAKVGNVLCDHQISGGVRDGGFEHMFDFPHTFPLRAPWISSMAQGEGASLLVRLHLETGSDRFAECAVRALAPMSVPTAQGGAMNLLGGRPFPEEYPTQPASFVLNGGIFSMWGLYDAGKGLGDSAAASAFEDALDTLAGNIGRWDTGWWSRYDLYPHPVTNVASMAYHELHINQLRAMAIIAPRPELAATAARFEGYRDSRLSRGRAFASKAAFRLRVPRGKLAPVSSA